MWSVHSFSRGWRQSRLLVNASLPLAASLARHATCRGFAGSNALLKASSTRSSASKAAAKATKATKATRTGSSASSSSSSSSSSASAASSSTSSTGAAAASSTNAMTDGLSFTQKAAVVYVIGALAALGIIARFKYEGEEPNEFKVYNLARRKLAKDRRLFEIVGYPKEFQKIETSGMAGRFRVIGDKGQIVVSYSAVEDASFDNSIRFDKLMVEHVDSTNVSDASDATTKDVSPQQQEHEAFSVLTEADDPVIKQAENKTMSDLLSKKLVFPVLMGSLIGGFSGFYIIRIMRNRPSYVHKLVLGRINEHPSAVTLLGSPIKCNKKQFVGKLTYGEANYSIACQGPRGKGMLFVKATKYLDKNSIGAGMTAQSEWKFNTLTLSVPRNELRSKDKQAKVINLLQQQ